MPRARVVTHAVSVVVAVASGLGLTLGGCGTDPSPELFVRPFDAGGDGDATDERGPEIDPTLGGPCTEDSQCNDAIACTFDRCDLTLSRCRNVPDDTQCANPSYCDGREKCVLRQGCAAGPVVTCQDDDPCTIDRCIEATKGCEHKQRDLDGDGDPDNHCVGKRDCDDLDPNVSSTHSEVCANGKDDNCNGVLDEATCVQPANDVCATALAVTASGTYLLSTVGTKRDFITTCSVAVPGAAKDVVIAITVPGTAADPLKDVEVWTTAQSGQNEVAVAMQAACGQAATELGCARIALSNAARTIARGVVPGSTIYAVVATQKEGAVDVKVDIRAAAPKPANEACGSTPVDVAIDVPFTVSLIDATVDVPTGCDKSKTGELTYAFTLPGPGLADVRIFASTLVGGGDPVVSLRDTACADELRCRVGTSPPLFARGLAPGPHVFTVSGTRHIDATVLVKTYPATPAPDNQTCATAPVLGTTPPLAINTSFPVDLSAQEDAIRNGCLPGGLAAAYDLELTAPSDVLVVGRFPPNEGGAVALHGTACTTTDSLGCSTGPSPQRVSKRNVPAGSYRVVIADELGQTAQLSVLVRPAVPPTSVGASDSCVAPFTIPSTGGFFTGDTTNLAADFNAGCDAPGQPIGGARDQIMRFDLAQDRRVVFDMTGSFYTTILDVRKGAACPGTEVANACFVGFNAGKSFLDLQLTAGTYWIQVDGYNGDRGPWNLDVRVLPP